MDVHTHTGAGIEIGNRIGDTAEIGAQLDLAIVAFERSARHLFVEQLQAFDPAGEILHLFGNVAFAGLHPN